VAGGGLHGGKVEGVGRVTQRRPVTRYDAGQAVTRPDTLAVEEPLEIRVDGTAVSVTMRTPGHDLDLDNLQYFVKSIPWLDEVSIGHALICDALYLGFENAVQLYKRQLAS